MLERLGLGIATQEELVEFARQLLAQARDTEQGVEHHAKVGIKPHTIDRLGFGLEPFQTVADRLRRRAGQGGIVAACRFNRVGMVAPPLVQPVANLLRAS